MVSDLTRKQIWLSQHDADALSRHYQAMNRRYWAFDMASMCLLVAGGVATVVLTSLDAEQTPEYAYWSVGAVVVIVSIWVMLAQFARKAAMSHSISQQCGEVMRSLEELHTRIDLYQEEDEDNAREAYERLRRRLDEVSERSGDFGLPLRTRAFRKHTRNAREAMENSNSGRNGASATAPA